MRKPTFFLFILLLSSIACKKDAKTCWMCMNGQSKAIWERCDVTEQEMKAMTGAGKPCVYYVKN